MKIKGLQQVSVVFAKGRMYKVVRVEALFPWICRASHLNGLGSEADEFKS